MSPELKVFPTTTLSFWHRFSFEEDYDGGVLEVSTNGGRTWRDVVEAGGAFLHLRVLRYCEPPESKGIAPLF